MDKFIILVDQERLENSFSICFVLSSPPYSYVCIFLFLVLSSLHHYVLFYEFICDNGEMKRRCAVQCFA